MKNQQSIKVNFIYNLIYQILALIIPIITAPYVSRILGPNGIGVYSYTYSIVYYFMLLTLLGVNNYGNRIIAKVRDDKYKLSKTFISVYLLQMFCGIIMLLLYFIYIFLTKPQDILISIILSIFILSSVCDINWFFFGLEQFKKTVTRNIFIKIVNVILIFIFVKKENDLWKYALIMSCMTFLGQLLLWPFLKKEIFLVKVKISDIFKHVKPNLILFIPVLAVSFYKIMDKIMLGILTNMDEVGYYENAEKIITIPFTLITALGTVMLPRISNIVSNGDIKKAKKYISKSIQFVLFLSLPMCFGLMAIGEKFAPLFFGIDFQKTGILIMLLAITLPFLSFANVLRTQYLIPIERDKEYIISVFLGAIVNLVINFIFIPKLAGIGACIGTICAEIVVTVYQSFVLRKELDIKEYVISNYKFYSNSFIMFIIIYSIRYLSLNSVVEIIIQVILGIAIYFILNYRYILLNIKTIFFRRKDNDKREKN